MSPNMAFRVANRNGKVSQEIPDLKGQCMSCFILLGLSCPLTELLLHLSLCCLLLLGAWHYNMEISKQFNVFQGFTFLISSDYERAEWREIIREQQKKCEWQYYCVITAEGNGTFINIDLHFAGFKSFSLTSLELQMLTNSCVKLQTVHTIPMTMNKEGHLHLFSGLHSPLR